MCTSGAAVGPVGALASGCRIRKKWPPVGMRPFTLDGLTNVPTTIPFEDPLYWGHDAEQFVAFCRPKIDWLRGCAGGSRTVDVSR